MICEVLQWLKGRLECTLKRFEFHVQQRPVSPGRHSWVAVETRSSCAPVPLPNGGTQAATGEDLVGKYPEIQEHLFHVHGMDVALAYIPSLDRYEELPDGNYDWIFLRQGDEIIVHDIPRVRASVTICGPTPTRQIP